MIFSKIKESRVKAATPSKKTKNEAKPVPPQNPVKSQNKVISKIIQILQDSSKFMEKNHCILLTYQNT
jgi:hypothetical protein